jgi:hypothetical protein
VDFFDFLLDTRILLELLPLGAIQYLQSGSFTKNEKEKWDPEKHQTSKS